MFLGRGPLAVAVLLALALSLPAVASARSIGGSWFFSVPASDGYRLDVSIAGDHADVFVDGRTAYVEYDAPVEVRDGMVEARFGGLGEMAVKFVPSGPPKRSDEPDGCHGPRPTYQKGHAVGSFLFRGERGYVLAATHRAAAVFERGFSGLCQGVGGHPEVPNLVARAKSARRTVSVSTFFREFEVATHAEITERVGVMKIWRSVGLAAPLSAASAQAEGSVFITPPLPFSGSALYAPRSSGARWTGDLSVVFPGLGPVSLAGRRFHVSVRHPLPAALSWLRRLGGDQGRPRPRAA